MRLVKEGDNVIIDFISVEGNIMNTITGKLTKIWDDEPYCNVDNKNVDLVGEAHTTKVSYIPNNKILVIGQALPAVKQEYPYDTTMLYDWLTELGISKAHAQHIFEFEAVYGEFPGYDAQNNHLKPTIEQMDMYYSNVLKDKVNESDKIIFLGNVSKEYFKKKEYDLSNKEVIELIHPSKRNYSLYQKNKLQIQSKLRTIIYE